ncbi:opioid growth factor receptor-related protein [Litchfieldella xinjiangensis]|uniref:opioid growth factor receptor-related protein n=1 Tax=Litchfieldella xinjiangensis TaxID=1166948 RepID=UPI0006934636|nr:opioid growth factor receptor-related protein [Halomonas xinjiangensis]
MEGKSHLISFYLGESHDHAGRKIEQIWQLSHFWLEHTHDYIQWLFPIPETSRFNSFAPALEYSEREEFSQSTQLQLRQQRSLDVMLDFFGLTRNGLEIMAKPDLSISHHIWLKRGGHNHLRITRIIRSLYFCGQVELAEAFQSAVIRIGSTQGIVAEESKQYWRKATEQPS